MEIPRPHLETLSWSRQEWREARSRMLENASPEEEQLTKFVDEVNDPELDKIFVALSDEDPQEASTDQARVPYLAVDSEGELDWEIDLTDIKDDKTWHEAERARALGQRNGFGVPLPDKIPLSEIDVERVFDGLITPKDAPVEPVSQSEQKANFEQLFAADTDVKTKDSESEEFETLRRDMILEVELIAAGADARDDTRIKTSPILTDTPETPRTAKEKRGRLKRFGAAIATGVLAVGVMIGGMFNTESNKEALSIPIPVEVLTPQLPTQPETTTSIELADEETLRFVLDGLADCTRLYGDKCLDAMEFASIVNEG
jgi:hypothetical protein